MKENQKNKYSIYLNYLAIIIVVIALGLLVGYFIINLQKSNSKLESIKIRIYTSIPVGENQLAEVEFNPPNAKENLTWYSDNENIATVENGVITGKNIGVTTIRAVTESGIKDTINITVYKKADSLTLDKENVELKLGETVQLNATITPEEASQYVYWESSNEEVATANSGLIKALSVGEATITATTKDGLSQKCTVTVLEKTAAEIQAEKEQEKQVYINSCQSYSYKEIFRNSEKYVGKNARFTGEVIQVMEGTGYYQVRMYVTKSKYGNYYTDDVIMAFIPKSALSGRILEDDIITIYGNLGSLYSYESVMGATITVPRIDVLYANLVK